VNITMKESNRRDWNTDATILLSASFARPPPVESFRPLPDTTTMQELGCATRLRQANSAACARPMEHPCQTQKARDGLSIGNSASCRKKANERLFKNWSIPEAVLFFFNSSKPGGKIQTRNRRWCPANPPFPGVAECFAVA
jgi:hypothetical protein